MDKKVRITQVKGIVRTLPNQRENVRSLGLHGIGTSVEKQLNPAIAGMIRKVNHLIKVEDI